MVQFEPKKTEIDQIGSQLVYLAAEKREGFWKPTAFLQKHPISFAFLLDEDRSVTRAYGLYHAFGHDALHIAHPATLLVCPEGVVRYLYRGKHQLDRAPLEQIMEAATPFRSKDHQFDRETKK